MTGTDQLRDFIEGGSIAAIVTLLQKQPGLANQKIVWGSQGENHTDPLHYVSDCVFNALLADKAAAEIALVLIEYGADINGSDGSESPLIGAASLSAVSVAEVLINQGADLQRVSIFSATALHWAAYVGIPTVVRALLDKGAIHDVKCVEFQSTPLFWAVQGFSIYGPDEKAEQLESARLLIEHGADVHTRNIENVTAIVRSRDSVSDSMTRLLAANGASG